MSDFMDLLNELDETPTTTGQLIRAFCKSFGITQRNIAELTGIKEPNVSAICNDKLSLTVENAKKIGAVLGVHPSVILFPETSYKKTKEIKEIEKKAKKLRKSI